MIHQSLSNHWILIVVAALLVGSSSALTSAFQLDRMNIKNRATVLRAHLQDGPQQQQQPQTTAQTITSAALATFLSVAITTMAPLPALATSKTAAHISVNSLPPTSVSIQIGDLPVVGGLLSGTYVKSDGSTKDLTKTSSSTPSIVIQSPKDKLGAIQAAASSGHLEFDVDGQTGLQTHLDIDLAAEEAGVARVRVASGLIPKLPFQNLASSSSLSTSTSASTAPKKRGGKSSDWNVVTNLGNGAQYYYNAKTGDTQFDKPAKL